MSVSRCFSATHTGSVRTENQDALICRDDIGVYAIADGAGGHNHGRQAANTVIEALAGIPAELASVGRLSEVRRRLHEAHHILLHGGSEASMGRIMASTVAVLLLDLRHFVCLWAGDSRIYLWRENTLLQLTRDHSLVQEMMDAGVLHPTAARVHPKANVITRAVGAGLEDLRMEKRTGELHPGDRFLLCSDGLNKTMRDDEIQRFLVGSGDVAAMMLETALRRRARDNISIIVVNPDVSLPRKC